MPIRTQTDVRYEVTFPPAATSADQDAEFCDVVIDGATRRIRFHDYHEIYSIPGLYEQLFYDELECQSPDVVCDRFEAAGADFATLRVLDLGAGNGMVSERLRERGVETIVGVDIVEEAAMAAERDRPDVYDEYVVDDVGAPNRENRKLLESVDFNCMVSVAALGFGDVPAEAFAAALSHVEEGGWMAFSIKDEFLHNHAGPGFARMIARGIDSGALEVLDRHVYQHRLSAGGDALHYASVIARKRDELTP
ncbi:MAG: class I SAM-dependent methyltransferase [Thermoleophilaceae bacterium]|nr:class I SAM-dependent methyltransferase [Thermoleophilaceae bacterium]